MLTDTILTWIEKSDQWILMLILGIIGSLAKTASDADTSFKKFIVATVQGIFVCIIVILCLIDVSLSTGIKAAIVGMSGWSHATVVKLIDSVFIKRLTEKLGITQPPVMYGRRSGDTSATEEKKGVEK